MAPGLLNCLGMKSLQFQPFRFISLGLLCLHLTVGVGCSGSSSTVGTTNTDTIGGSIQQGGPLFAPGSEGSGPGLASGPNPGIAGLSTYQVMLAGSTSLTMAYNDSAPAEVGSENGELSGFASAGEVSTESASIVVVPAQSSEMPLSICTVTYQNQILSVQIASAGDLIAVGNLTSEDRNLDLHCPGAPVQHFEAANPSAVNLTQSPVKLRFVQAATADSVGNYEASDEETATTLEAVQAFMALSVKGAGGLIELALIPYQANSGFQMPYVAIATGPDELAEAFVGAVAFSGEDLENLQQFPILEF